MCSWIEELKAGTNKFLIKELETGYVVLSKYQYYKGYTLFLSKHHETELHMLKPEVRDKFLHEMAAVAEAVYKAVKPDKLNYELLGNNIPHLHWHIIPRVSTETNPEKPIWTIDKTVREAESAFPTEKERDRLKMEISKHLQS